MKGGVSSKGGTACFRRTFFFVCLAHICPDLVDVTPHEY